MTRSARTAAVVLAIAVTASLAAASVVSAATTGGKVCPSLTGRTWHTSYKARSGTRYQWSVVGTGFTCASAKPWVLKLINTRVARSKDGSNVALRNGPKGYHCYASLTDTNGYAFIGMCFKGTIAFPGSGFQWAGS